MRAQRAPSSKWIPRIGLGLLAAGVLWAIISIAVGEGGPSRVEIDGTASVQRLYGGLEQDGPYLGSSDAPVAISVFNDLQAPSGRDFQLRVVDPLVEGLVRPGDVRLQMRHWPFGSRPTTVAAIAAAAAAPQAREWQYADLFFRNQRNVPGAQVTDDYLADLAAALPELDVDEWDRARGSTAVAERLEADGRAGEELRLTPAPAVVVTGPGGTEQLAEAPSRAEVEAAVEAVR